MPDKRDIHKAKSHRNSKSNKRQQQPATRQQAAAESSVTTIAEPDDVMAPMGKKNKSRR
jgi:hypothetical protein